MPVVTQSVDGPHTERRTAPIKRRREALDVE
jgi:hypothetical protein